MAIKFVELDSLDTDQLEEAELKVLSDGTEVEAKYTKCPKTGEVRVTIEDFEDLPVNQLVLLTLKNHDGKDSEYQGVISEGTGTFITV